MFSYYEEIKQIKERKTHHAPGLNHPESSESSSCAALNPEGVVFLCRCHIIRPCDQVNETGSNFSCLLPRGDGQTESKAALTCIFPQNR